MRIVSPIEGTINLDPESVKACLEANFESVMNTRYAVYQDFVWSVFTHPLKSLSRERVIAATSQVYSSVKTFGTHYSCSLLEIPNRDNK